MGGRGGVGCGVRDGDEDVWVWRGMRNGQACGLKTRMGVRVACKQGWEHMGVWCEGWGGHEVRDGRGHTCGQMCRQVRGHAFVPKPNAAVGVSTGMVPK